MTMVTMVLTTRMVVTIIMMTSTTKLTYDDDDLGVLRHGELPLLQGVLQLFRLQLQLLLRLAKVPEDDIHHGDDGDFDGDVDCDDNGDDAVDDDLLLCLFQFSLLELWEKLAPRVAFISLSVVLAFN